MKTGRKGERAAWRWGSGGRCGSGEMRVAAGLLLLFALAAGSAEAFVGVKQVSTGAVHNLALGGSPMTARFVRGVPTITVNIRGFDR